MCLAFQVGQKAATYSDTIFPFTCPQVSARMRIFFCFLLALSSLLLGTRAQNQVFIEEHDSSLVFSPPSISWYSNKNPQPGPNGTSVLDYYHNDGYLSIDIAGASITFIFDGSYIAYFSDLYFTHGEMEIDLDGQKTRITTYSNNYSEGTPQVKLFETNVDPDVRNHVIKLTNLENKMMALDYFLLTPLPIPSKSTSPVSTSAAEGNSSETTPIHRSPPSTLPTATVGTAGISTPVSGSPPISTTTVVLISFVSSLTLVLVAVVCVFCIRRCRRQRNDADAIRAAAGQPLSPVHITSSVVPFLLHPASGKKGRVESMSSTSRAADPSSRTWDIDYAAPPSYVATHTTQ